MRHQLNGRTKGINNQSPFRSSLCKFPVNLFKFFSLISSAQFLPLTCSYLKHMKMRGEWGLLRFRFFLGKFCIVDGKKTTLFLLLQEHTTKENSNGRKGLTMLLWLLHTVTTSVHGRWGRQMMLHSWDWRRTKHSRSTEHGVTCSQNLLKWKCSGS